jgi:hypothetical protein
VAARVSPTETIRAEIHQLFESGGELLSVVEQVARLSVRLRFQSVIDEIVCAELGRGRYQRRREDSPERYRNGWQQPRTLKTSLGPVELQRPKLRHAHAALCEQLFGQGVSRTNALETLVISCWVRGLSGMANPPTATLAVRPRCDRATRPPRPPPIGRVGESLVRPSSTAGPGPGRLAGHRWPGRPYARSAAALPPGCRRC